MDSKDFTKPDNLERYSFIWSQLRLLIAAMALFIGGTPPILKFNPVSSLYSPLSSLLTVAWIISGLASLYLLYRWKKNHKKIFGGRDQRDMLAFFVSIVSGFNLGLTGLLGANIGMSISSNQVIFFIVGFLYLAAAWHLHNRWKSNKQKVF